MRSLLIAATTTTTKIDHHRTIINMALYNIDRLAELTAYMDGQVSFSTGFLPEFRSSSPFFSDVLDEISDSDT